MKKLVIPVLILLALAVAACGQSAEQLNKTGNEAFTNEDYSGALTAYLQAQDESPELAEPHYNAANSHYRLEAFDQAQQEIQQTLVNEEVGASLAQHSLYNLGNTFFQTEQYETAIEAYKEALRLNPDDLEAKQNLELALRQLQQQQQEQQQDQQQEDQENQDQQDQQQQDEQQQDEQQQDEQQQGEQQQDQQQDDQQQEDQQQDGRQDDQRQEDQQQDGQQDEQQQEDQQQDGQQDEQQQNGQPDEPQRDGQAEGQPQEMVGLSEEQARQLFAAAAQGTESLEEYLQQILVFPGAPPAKDW
jgi:Ca-activated chloride channel family protein